MSKDIKGDIYTRNSKFRTELEQVFKKLLASDRTVFYDSLIRELEILYRIPTKTIVEEIQMYVNAKQIEIFEEDNKKMIAVLSPWKIEKTGLI